MLVCAEWRVIWGENDIKMSAWLDKLHDMLQARLGLIEMLDDITKDHQIKSFTPRLRSILVSDVMKSEIGFQLHRIENNPCTVNGLLTDIDADNIRSATV